METTSRSPSSNSSMSVLAINELVEHIFSFLDADDLVRAQRVCKKWLAVSTSSIKMQEILFLSPIKASPAIMQMVLDPRVPHRTHQIMKYCKVGSPGTTTVVRLNPAITNTGSPIKGLWNSEDCCVFDGQHLLNWTQVQGRWNKMFFTQPPVCAVSLNYLTTLKLTGATLDREYTSEEPFREFFKITRSRGVTLDDIAQHLRPVMITQIPRHHATGELRQEYAELSEVIKTLIQRRQREREREPQIPLPRIVGSETVDPNEDASNPQPAIVFCSPSNSYSFPVPLHKVIIFIEKGIVFEESPTARSAADEAEFERAKHLAVLEGNKLDDDRAVLDTENAVAD